MPAQFVDDDADPLTREPFKLPPINQRAAYIDRVLGSIAAPVPGTIRRRVDANITEVYTLRGWVTLSPGTPISSYMRTT